MNGGALVGRMGTCKGSAVGRGLVLPLGPEDIAISIILVLPCLVAGCRFGDILGTDVEEQRKFSPVIMVQTYGNVCAKDDGVDQEATIE